MLREFKGDILSNMSRFDGVCITSNGTVRSDGACVMGAGIAKSFRDMFPGIDRVLGSLIRKSGNHCYLLGEVRLKNGDRVKVFSFVVKHNWWEEADVELIERSCEELMAIVDEYGLSNVALPRPGGGCGRLNWEDVRPRLEEYLDDRVVVCSF